MGAKVDKNDCSLVNFSVVGAQKSGTTALRHFLSLHPDLGVTKDEPHYFDQEWKEDNAQSYAGLHELFTPEALQKVSGDVTPVYLYLDGCLERLKEYNPKMKIIVLLRDPVERAYSQWVMQREKGQESRSFLPAILNEFSVYRKSGQSKLYSYVQRGFYDKQLANLFSIFPEEQCLILPTKALDTDHEQTLAKVFNFLGVDPLFVPAKARIHSRSYSPPSYLERFILRCLYFSSSRKVERRLNWQRTDWRN